MMLKRLPLHNGVNVRDLGGYPIGDDHMSAYQRCYRSDDPYRFDEHDWNLLKSLKVDRILDLRSISEQEMSVCACEDYGIKHVSLPFLKEKKMEMEPHDQEAMKTFINSMKLDYVEMFKEANVIMPAIMHEIADSLQRKHAVLFHCTAGKDRTGIVAAILLDICGVSQSDILCDYQVSATYNAQGVNKRFGREALKNPVIRSLLESRVDMMEPLLAYFHETSCEQRLLDMQVSQRDIDMIKQELIVHI